MDTTHIPTLIQMADYVSTATGVVQLRCRDKTEGYRYIERVCKQYHYPSLPKRDKGTIRAYVCAVTGYADAQVDRLIGKYKATGTITPTVRTQPTYRGIYTRADIVELARLDDLYEGLSGPAMCIVLKREYERFGNAACARLCHLSTAQLYRFRRTDRYR